MLSNDFDRQAVDDRRFYVVVHDGKSPARLNMELVRLLQQQQVAIFSPQVAYDGQKIVFSTHDFLGQNNSQTVTFLV